MFSIYMGIIFFVVALLIGYAGWACGYAAAVADRDEEEAQTLLANRQSNANRWGTQ